MPIFCATHTPERVRFRPGFGDPDSLNSTVINEHEEETLRGTRQRAQDSRAAAGGDDRALITILNGVTRDVLVEAYPHAARALS